MKIAADANVLLSAVIGGRARLVLDHPEIDEVVTTETTFAEVREYAVLLGRKKKLAPDTLLLTVAALPVSIMSPEVYADAMAEARRLIAWRDPDDIEILALTLHLKIPLWSNDNDFEGCGIERFTTAGLLNKLGIFDVK
ncbi:MAG TPA: PIN domain-containing protein [Terracidiphilus sp.]|nr:PIN domain-containing protein [Terracidiphilus sp.]